MLNIQYTVCEYYKYMIYIHCTIHVSDNISVNQCLIYV